MRLSVVIPTFNRASVLPRAIDSVLQQKAVDGLSDIQIIVVDDASTDNTQQLIAQDYPNVDYIKHEQNLGVSCARNTAIEHARGEWIALLDSDDQWLPDKLRLQFDALQQHQKLVCHTEEIWIRDGVRVNQMKKHQKPDGWIFKQCLPLCAMSPSSIIIHRQVFERVGVFDANFPACEDYDLWLRICAQFDVTLITQPCINKFGGHEDQLSRQFWGMDRFRVLALEKILNTTLSADNYSAAKSMLEKKLTILLKGARKHQNAELIESCQSKLDYWQNQTSQ